MNHDYDKYIVLSGEDAEWLRNSYLSEWAEEERASKAPASGGAVVTAIVW